MNEFHNEMNFIHQIHLKHELQYTKRNDKTKLYTTN